jgi:hypothetical protein
MPDRRLRQLELELELEFQLVGGACVVWRRDQVVESDRDRSRDREDRPAVGV